MSAMTLSAGAGDAPDRTFEKINQRISRDWVSDGVRNKGCEVAADAELVRQSQKGDAAAFEQLVRNHQRMIHALTYRMTGSLADAEDLAQEACLRAYEQIRSFRGAAQFSTWFYRIALNVCLNWRRDEARRNQLQARYVDTLNDVPAGPAANSGEAETCQRVQEALLRLPPAQRAAIVLTVYEGHNHAEAAHLLGCSETTVSWRVYMARRKLKQWLTGDKPAHE
ncbi:MAG TPA: RNA polymerase sigma factor [Dongiaceae bacterium]|nr:RNA polymerase sigma factor [Dongiaceae bacterium]